MSKVEIILVKYNRPDMEANTMRAVLATTSHPNYTLTAYQNQRGVGLAKCWNRLIAASDAEYIVLLNTDTVTTPGWLDEMITVLEKGSNVVAVVPCSNNAHMSQVMIPFPNETLDWGVINGFALTVACDAGTYCSLESASAMCVLFRRSLWESLGGFDERFQFYGEDTDFFYRAAKLGRVAWAKGAYVHHYGQQSFAKAEQDGELVYQDVRNQAAKLWAEKLLEMEEDVSR